MQYLEIELQSFLQFVKLQLHVVFNDLQISNASSHVSVYLKLAITRVTLSSGNIYSRFYQKCRYAC